MTKRIKCKDEPPKPKPRTKRAAERLKQRESQANSSKKPSRAEKEEKATYAWMKATEEFVQSLNSRFFEAATAGAGQRHLILRHAGRAPRVPRPARCRQAPLQRPARGPASSPWSCTTARRFWPNFISAGPMICQNGCAAEYLAAGGPLRPHGRIGEHDEAEHALLEAIAGRDEPAAQFWTLDRLDWARRRVRPGRGRLMCSSFVAENPPAKTMKKPTSTPLPTSPSR